jgi:hypothetical protein
LEAEIVVNHVGEHSPRHSHRPLDEQSRLREAFTADFTVVRALLEPGRPR